MQAAVGLSQLERLPGFVDVRKKNFEFLKSGLKKLEDYFILPEATPGSEPSWFGFPLTLRKEAPFTRGAILDYLNERRIGTRLLFGSNLLRQPYMIGRHHRVVGALANSDIIVERTFWIGVYPGLSESEISWMIDSIHQFVLTHGKN